MQGKGADGALAFKPFDSLPAACRFVFEQVDGRIADRNRAGNAANPDWQCTVLDAINNAHCNFKSLKIRHALQLQLESGAP